MRSPSISSLTAGTRLPPRMTIPHCEVKYRSAVECSPLVAVEHLEVDQPDVVARGCRGHKVGFVPSPAEQHEQRIVRVEAACDEQGADALQTREVARGAPLVRRLRLPQDRDGSGVVAAPPPVTVWANRTIGSARK